MMQSTQLAEALTALDDAETKLYTVEVISGLNQPQKQLPTKLFYDTTGCMLFDQICELPEYYPYRTELNMLPIVAEHLASPLDGAIDLIEFGAGSLFKVEALLARLPQIKRFFPIDIAAEHLQSMVIPLQKNFPQLYIKPIAADFTQRIHLPEFSRNKRLGFFPGSTIGNFSPQEAAEFLKSAKRLLGDDALFLLGVDTKKSPAVLHRAYNDEHGLTARFNRNLLHHINRITDADFQPRKFYHYAFYNPHAGRVEMHLVSQEAQTVTVSGRSFELEIGESIHTENSYKYAPAEFIELASSAGWQVTKTWIAKHGLFSLHLLGTRGR